MTYGLIGVTLKHSYSKEIHNFLGNKEFELKEIHPKDLDQFMMERSFKGINVTIPYKEKVMKYCKVSPQAQKIGAVNTIVNEDGDLYGYNTDYFGFLEIAKRQGISFKRRKVLILGSGGTSKTVRAVVEDEGAGDVINISRSGENTYTNIDNHHDADIIVNTTPIGMFPNNMQSPLDTKRFVNLEAAIDVVYNPLNTKFLLQRKDVKTAGGLPMLVAQALYAHNLFFDANIEDKLGAAIEYSTKIFSNYVLIGMPGVGKTTTGKRLAKQLDLKFVDTDWEISKREGGTPKEIIEADGEEVFREIESNVVAEICKTGGQVIATGGGSILREENRLAMRQNGRIIYLHRALDTLSVRGRPLSGDLKKLFEQRRSIYEELSDIRILNSTHPDVSVRKIRQHFSI